MKKRNLYLSKNTYRKKKRLNAWYFLLLKDFLGIPLINNAKS